MTKWCFSFVLAFALAAGVASAAEPAKFELHKGDHVCIIGNTLAERMQHDGWLETFIRERFPGSQRVFRNLVFSGSEVRLDNRIRSLNFGTPDEWLAGNAPPPPYD